jgi:hypothetical protein
MAWGFSLGEGRIIMLWEKQPTTLTHCSKLSADMEFGPRTHIPPLLYLLQQPTKTWLQRSAVYAAQNVRSPRSPTTPRFPVKPKRSLPGQAVGIKQELLGFS